MCRLGRLRGLPSSRMSRRLALPLPRGASESRISSSLVSEACSDQPGGLADILAVFDEYALSVEYLYAFAGGSAGRAIIVLRVEDHPEVEKLCQDRRLKLMTPAELYQ